MIIRRKISTVVPRVLKVLLRGVYGRYLLLYVAAILSAFLEIIGIGLVFPLVFSVLGSNEAGGLPAPIIHLLGLLHLEGNIVLLGIILVAVFFGKAFFMFLVQYGNARITHEIRARWMKRLFKQYITSNLQFFIKTPHGQLVYNLYDLTQQCLYGVRQLISLFAYGISSIVIIGILMMISWQVTLVTAAVLAIVYLIINRPLLSRAHAIGKASYKQQQKVNAFPNEAFRGIREIKTYSMQTMILGSYRELVDHMTRLNQKIQYYQLLPPLLPEVLIVTLLTVAIIILNGMPHLNLALMLSLITTYTYALFRLFLNGSVLVQSTIMISTIWPVMEHLTEMLVSDNEREVSSGRAIALFSGVALACHGVSYSYDDKTQVVNNVTAIFHPGKLTAIVGGSGAGKSTLADLLLRMVEPSSGEISFGSENIASYQIDSWRRLIGFVSQDTFLFHGTIRDNIAFGANDASDQDIARASNQAGAHEFIEALPDGYESVVGERGAKLSGGQRQRIAIARALVRQPKILIFDEATSALDARSEALIKETLLAIKRDVIVIFISHRLSSVVDADNILVMKNGQLLEQGSHDDLLAKQGEYWRLCQFYH